jgi:hypothetical protein
VLWDEGIKEKIWPPRGLGGFHPGGQSHVNCGGTKQQMRRSSRSEEQRETAGEEEDGAFSAIVRTVTLAALGAAHHRQAPRSAGAS